MSTTSRSPMKPTDWILLALAVSPDGKLSPVQIQKCLFLLKENYHSALGKKFYSFVPYSYGPFDSAIYHDLDLLIASGQVQVLPLKAQRSKEYSLTAAGKKLVLDIKKSAPEEPAEYLSLVVNWARKLTFSQLVRAIYDKYPKYRKNSVFQY